MAQPWLGDSCLAAVPAGLRELPPVEALDECLAAVPVGMQVTGRHHTEPLLRAPALLMERERPWPLVEPGSPR